MNFKIIGTGSARPACVKTNNDLAEFLDTSDEWIRTRTGIEERHVMQDGESISQLATQAAQAALQNAGTDPQELDFIICSTIRGDYITPSMACIVAKNLGVQCMAFDMNAACSGFIYALDCATGYFERGRAQKGLIVSAEAMSKMVDWKDRATCVLFGDAAGAVVLEKGDSLLASKLSSDGNVEVLNIPHVYGNSPFSSDEHKPSYLFMDGHGVYKFAVNAMATGLADTIAAAGLKQDEVDHVLPHQANLRIIQAAMKKLDIPEDRYRTNIAHYGNTSSACIPVLLDELNQAGMLKRGQILALTAFGGGLTTGAMVIRW